MNKLNNSEKNVIKLSSEGLLQKQIARELGLSYNTVKNYSSSAIKKLNTGTMAGSVALCLREKIID